MNYCYFHSPLGDLLLAGDADGLQLINLPCGSHARQPAPEWVHDEAVFADAARQLREYFAGERRAFDLDLNPAGTAFQLEVWHALQRIPYGRTVSYGELARRLGRASASRAIGAANGANPLPVVVPCHRVIGADGGLTGFGGGLAAKRWLLDHEQGTPSLFAAAASTR